MTMIKLQHSFSIDHAIQGALNNASSLLDLETLLAAGVPFKKIEKVCNRALKNASANQETVKTNYATLKQWRKEHKKGEEKVDDVLDQIFHLEDPSGAKREVELFLLAGGSIEQVCDFLNSHPGSSIEEQILILENIAEIAEAEAEDLLPLETPQKAKKKGKLRGRKKKTREAKSASIQELHQRRRAELIGKPSSSHHRILKKAIENKELKRLKLLIELGFNPNAIDANGNSILMTAIQYGNTDAALILLEQGASVDHANPHGLTPLHYAIGCTLWEVAEYLLNHGADVNHQDEKGFTPLHRVKQRSSRTPPSEQKKIWEALIAYGADPTIRDYPKGIPCNTPLRQQVVFGDFDGIASLMFQDYPAILDVMKNCPKEKRMEEMRKKASELTTPQSRNPELLPLEIPFLLQDPQLAGAMAAHMPEDAIREQMMRIQEKYPQAEPRVLLEASYAPQKSYILKFGEEIDSSEVFDEDYDKERQQAKLQRLADMLDRILLTEEGYALKQENPDQLKGRKYAHYLKIPGDPGYRGPRFTNANGDSFTALKLRDKLNILLNDIEVRQPIAGSSSNPKEREHWYRLLEANLCQIIDIVEIEDEMEATKDDPTPNAATIIEIALTGGTCGGWYMGDAQKIKQQKTGSGQGLENQVLTVLQSLHQRTCEGLVPRNNRQNTHIMNKILQVIDESAGIQEEQKNHRFYFLDPITPLDADQLESDAKERYWQAYHATAIIDELDHAIHFSDAIERELVVDWLKENIPDQWGDGDSQVFNALRRARSRGQQYQILDKYQIAYKKPAPIEDQIFAHFLRRSGRLTTYQNAKNIALAMPGREAMAVRLIKNNYGIDLDPSKPLIPQIQKHFSSDLPSDFDQICKSINGKSYWEAADALKNTYGIKVEPYPSIEKILGEWRSTQFLSAAIPEESGRVSRWALIYMLNKIGILQAIG